MPLTPDQPFPKKQGDNIRSKDWNDAVNEVIRLDTAKLNLAGGNMTGPLNVSGNLGVGTTNPQAKLEVGGKVYINRGPAPDTAELRIYNGGAVSEWAIRQASATSHNLNVSKLVSGNYTDILTFDTGGNVGIGTTTPSDARLVVGGVTRWDTGIGVTGASSGGVGLFLENKEAGGHKYSLFSGGTANSGNLKGGFGLYDATAGDYRLMVDSSGRVGIGTASPDYPLTLQGDGGTYFIVKASNGAQQTLIGADAGGGMVSMMTNHDLQLRAGGNSNKVVVRANGNTTLLAANNPLNITAAWTASPDNVSNVSEISNATTGWQMLMIVGNRSGSSLRRVGIWDQLWVGGTLTNLSDLRQKQDITPLKDSLSSVLALRGVRFRWRAAGDDVPPSLGLIAQEVEGVFPDLVETGADGMKTLNYLGLIGPLVEAVKEQHAEIAELRAEVESLKSGHEN